MQQTTEISKTRYSVDISQINGDNNEEKTDVVQGTTYLFLLDDNPTDVSFNKIQLSSVRISANKYPTLSAIQTLQFQRTQRNIRGHACMINRQGKWKLFFVWNSSLIHVGSIIGYMYNGHQIESKDVMILSIPAKDKNFYWVNLNEFQFAQNVLLDLKYPVIEENGFYYGNHTPSMITLPDPPAFGCHSEFEELKNKKLPKLSSRKFCMK